MSKFFTLILLGIYFFSFAIPQYINGVYYVFDRASIIVLWLAIYNLIVFLILQKNRQIQVIYSLFNKNFHLKVYVLYIVIATLSLSVAVNVNEGILVLSKYTTYFFSFFLILILSKIKKIDFLQTFIVFTIISVLMESLRINATIYESVIVNGNFLDRSMAFRGFTGNINISSFSIAMKIPVLIYSIFKANNLYKRIFLAFLIYSSVLSIVLLSSRAALIAISLVFIFTLLYVIFKQNKKLLARFAIISISVFFSFVSYDYMNEKNTSDILIERFSKINKPIEDASVNERLNFYKIAVEDIISNPILGIGVGNWKLLSIQRGNKFLDGYRVPYNAHNDYLESFAEIGILGGLCFAYFIFYPFMISLFSFFNSKSNPQNLIIFLALGVYIFDSMLNFPIQRPVIVIYLFFIIALFYNLRKKEQLL